MKKVTPFIIILVLCFSLTACGSKSEEPRSPALDIPETATTAPPVQDSTLSNAVYMCQFVKDCLGEPDSFQIHGVSHIAENGQHFYYLDFSHEVKNSEVERTYYYAEFAGSTLLCIVNENSAIYYETDGDYTAKYPAFSSLFQEQSSEQLDVDTIASALQ